MCTSSKLTPFVRTRKESQEDKEQFRVAETQDGSVDVDDSIRLC